MKTLIVFALVCLIVLVQCDTGKIDPVEELSAIKILEDERLEEVISEEITEETVSEMVVRISCEIGLDPDIALALLKKENENYNVFADHYNEASGSHDLGLFQLNDRYIHTDFVPRYWKSDEIFDVFDAESNTFVALSHLKYLMVRFDYDILNAVRAYNGGEYAVASNNLKFSTVNYSRRIMQTIGYGVD